MLRFYVQHYNNITILRISLNYKWRRVSDLFSSRIMTFCECVVIEGCVPSCVKFNCSVFFSSIYAFYLIWHPQQLPFPCHCTFSEDSHKTFQHHSSQWPGKDCVLVFHFSGHRLNLHPRPPTHPWKAKHNQKIQFKSWTVNPSITAPIPPWKWKQYNKAMHLFYTAWPWLILKSPPVIIFQCHICPGVWHSGWLLVLHHRS